MAAQKEMVIVLSRGLDDERSSVAWSIANSGVASGFNVLMFLVSSGIDWARKGAAEHTHLNPMDPPMKDMVQNFVNGGGAIQACPPCVKVRGYDTSDLLDGVIMAGAPAMLEWVSRGASTLSF
jgi:predicted peroxiredoxin